MFLSMMKYLGNFVQNSLSIFFKILKETINLLLIMIIRENNLGRFLSESASESAHDFY